MKKNFLILVLVMLLPAFAWGQEQITITGTVMDESNFSVPGASIVEKGTTNGTVTDLDGISPLLYLTKMQSCNFHLSATKRRKFH